MNCAGCLNWQGNEQTYMGACPLAGRRTSFDEGCTGWVSKIRGTIPYAEVAAAYEFTVPVNVALDILQDIAKLRAELQDIGPPIRLTQGGS